MSNEYRVVDVFTDQPYDGNPAAVVLDARDLSDTAMQRVAAEFNLSETTFVLPPDDPAADLRIRWFTPGCEVDLCGHATLAGVHALIEAGRLPDAALDRDGVLWIETRSGVLEAKAERTGPDGPGGAGARAGRGADRRGARAAAEGPGLVIWLELPRPALEPYSLNPAIVREGLCVADDALDPNRPVMFTRDRDVIVMVRDFMALNGLRPNFGRLAELGAADRIRGFLVATSQTLTPSIRVQSRFFAPGVGINEDPVTGSAHGPLLAYLVHCGLVTPVDGVAGAMCVQRVPGGRGGLIHVLGRVVRGQLEEVQIGGRCRTVMRGVLAVDP